MEGRLAVQAIQSPKKCMLSGLQMLYIITKKECIKQLSDRAHLLKNLSNIINETCFSLKGTMV